MELLRRRKPTYAPSDELISTVHESTTPDKPIGELERLLWTMDLEHLAFFAAGKPRARWLHGAPDEDAAVILEEDQVTITAKQVLAVRTARESARQIRLTNINLVLATWALVVVTALLVFVSSG